MWYEHLVNSWTLNTLEIQSTELLPLGSHFNGNV